MTTPIQQNRPHFIEVDQLDSSAIEGLYHGDITQYLKITKYTIQKYLEACVRPEGQFRQFFNRFASFTIDYCINEALSDNPDQRHLQIARHYSGMRESPPQIFIQDGGYKYVPASMGQLTSGFNSRDRDGTQVVRVMDVIEIPVQIVCAALDEQLVEDLEALLSAAFGQFQRFTTGYVMRPPRGRSGIYWEVRVPLTHQMGSKSHAAFHDDPSRHIWQVTCDMTVEFENSTYIQYRAAPHYIPGVQHLNITIPDRIPLTQKTMFSVTDMPYPIEVFSDNSKIAVIDRMNTRFVISPKRLGTFNIIVVRGGAISTPSNEVIAQKEITVVLR